MKRTATIVLACCVTVVLCACQAQRNAPTQQHDALVDLDDLLDDPAEAIEPIRDNSAPPSPTPYDWRAWGGSDKVITARIGVAGQSEKRIKAEGMSCDLPDGWSVGPKKKKHVLTLIPPTAHKGGVLTITRSPGDAGGLKAGLQRLASGIGLRLAPPEKPWSHLPKVTVDEDWGVMALITNPVNSDAVFVIWVPRGKDIDQPDETWVFQFTGTAKQIDQLFPTITSVASSTRFGADD